MVVLDIIVMMLEGPQSYILHTWSSERPWGYIYPPSLSPCFLYLILSSFICIRRNSLISLCNNPQVHFNQFLKPSLLFCCLFCVCVCVCVCVCICVCVYVCVCVCVCVCSYACDWKLLVGNFCILHRAIYPWNVNDITCADLNSHELQ